MTSLFGFGFSQEDEITRAAALEVEDATVLSIASAGDVPLSMLALGARRVIAVDISEAQLHLGRLKSAAIQCLEREAASAFLGFFPASSLNRQRWLARCIDALPRESADYWLGHEGMLCTRGAIWCGRYEQFIRKAQLLIRPLLGSAFADLARCHTRPEQQALFDHRIGRPWLRLFFRLVFDPRIFSRYGIDPKSLEHRKSPVPLGAQYWMRFRSFCTDTPAANNPWLQLHTIGRLTSLDAVPSYLTAAGFARARLGLERLNWVNCDLPAYARNQLPADVTGVCLSNLPDWFGAAEFEQLIYELALRLTPNTRLVWCYLHMNRKLPLQLPRPVLIDEELGRRLHARDRFPFYTIVPARIA